MVTSRAMPHLLLPAELPPATTGVPYSVQLSVTPPPDPPAVFAGEGLPDGLAVSESGLLSGTPSSAGPYPSLVITAGGDDWEQAYPRPLMVMPAPLPPPPAPVPALRGMSPVRRANLGGRP